MTDQSAAMLAGTYESQPAAAQILASLLRADFTVQMRNRRSLLLGLLAPLIILIATRKVFSANPALLMASSMTVGQAAMAILGYSIATARDRERGVFQRLRVTPAPGWAIMGSRLVVQVVAGLVMAVIVLVAGYFIDGIALAPAGYVLALPVAVLASAVFLSIGQSLVGLVRSADTVNALSRIVYIALFMIGLFASTSRLGALGTVAAWSPYGVVTMLLSGVLDTSSWNMDTWLALPVSLAYITAFAAIGVRWFRWEAR